MEHWWKLGIGYDSGHCWNIPECFDLIASVCNKISIVNIDQWQNSLIDKAILVV